MNKIHSKISGRPVRNEDGFTLIEVLVAVAVIVLGLVMFAVVSGNIMKQNASMSKESIATTLAQDKVESIKNIGLTYDLTSANGFANPVYSGTVWSASSDEVIDAEGDATGENDAIYTRTWTITANATGAYLTDIYVDVTWTNGKTISVNTRISQ
ncbi:MAG: prepilin-type N-terminal cleavage/methylation domain-containing protein [Nitrospinae bacterium]|nr:prepilin-type N-terminal cleavage/methylation domain-containing protein [Nitrospinota bacterium]